MGKKLRVASWTLGAGLAGGTLLSGLLDEFSNTEGDGLQPRNSLTSRILGVEAAAECWKNYAYDHCSNSGTFYQPWCCEDETKVWAKDKENRKYLRPAETFSETMATAIGGGSELLAGLGLLALAFYRRR